jgi:hypothetical protein
MYATYGNHRLDLQGSHQLAPLYLISPIVSHMWRVSHVRKPPPGPPGKPPVGAATQRQDIVGKARYEQDLRKLGAPPGKEKGGREKGGAPEGIWRSTMGAAKALKWVSGRVEEGRDGTGGGVCTQWP